MRVVSLLPSATEIVCALGQGHRLVGRSHECDFPPSVTKLPRCTEPKFDVTGSSRAIHQRVQGVLQDSLSVYRVDAAQLKQLRPDLILTQAQCAVCAVGLSEVEAVVQEQIPSHPQLISLEPRNLADVFSDIRQVAKVLNVPKAADGLVARLEQRLVVIQEATCDLVQRPTVACVEWIDPLMAAGNWMPELVEWAGGVNLFGMTGKHSSWLSWEGLVRADPDVIVAMPCGFDLGRTRSELRTLMANPEWPKLSAVKRRRVWIADGNSYFNRPGPRLLDSLEMLAQALQPAAFAFDHHGLDLA